MRKTKKITLSASVVAIGTVMMWLGATFGILDLTACALASLLVAFVYIEIGSPYTFLVWICTSLLSFLFSSASLLWIEYFLIFGSYPIAKAYIERTHRGLWWLFKILYANVSMLILIFSAKLITGVHFFSVDSYFLIAGIYVLLNVLFVLYDIFLTVLISYYMRKLRPRFKTFLK
jgi:hypothetical protein